MLPSNVRYNSLTNDIYRYEFMRSEVKLIQYKCMIKSSAACFEFWIMIVDNDTKYQMWKLS